MSSLVKVSIQVICPFLNWIIFLAWSHMSSLYILEIKPLSNVSLTNTFFHNSQFHFYLDHGFFSCEEAFYFVEIPFFYSFLGHGDISVKIWLCEISEIFQSMFSSRSFMVSGLTLSLLSTLILFLWML